MAKYNVSMSEGNVQFDTNQRSGSFGYSYNNQICFTCGDDLVGIIKGLKYASHGRKYSFVPRSNSGIYFCKNNYDGVTVTQGLSKHMFYNRKEIGRAISALKGMLQRMGWNDSEIERKTYVKYGNHNQNNRRNPNYRKRY